MAPGISERSVQRKEDFLDLLQESFYENTKAYVSAVKLNIKSHEREIAAEILESAIEFLSQDFPDPAGSARDKLTRDDLSSGNNELTSLMDRISNLEKHLQEETNSVKQEAQNTCSSLELMLRSNDDSTRQNIQCLDENLNFLKDDMEEHRRETKKCMKKLSKVVQENRKNIKGLRKLQKLLQQRQQQQQVWYCVIHRKTIVYYLNCWGYSSRTTVYYRYCWGYSNNLKTAYRLSVFNNGLTSSIPRHKNQFTVKVAGETNPPCIYDAKLLPGGLIVLADWDKNSVKLFNIQNSLVMTSAYSAVAAVDNLTLAVGYNSLGTKGIVLVNLSGVVLCQICSTVHLYYMVATSDGHLMCSTWDNKIAKVELGTGQVIFNNA
ncbi:hypothetical protein PoB_005952300, partial [Plakobranchus ocellatus]